MITILMGAAVLILPLVAGIWYLIAARHARTRAAKEELADTGCGLLLIAFPMVINLITLVSNTLRDMRWHR